MLLYSITEVHLITQNLLSSLNIQSNISTIIKVTDFCDTDEIGNEANGSFCLYFKRKGGLEQGGGESSCLLEVLGREKYAE